MPSDHLDQPVFREVQRLAIPGVRFISIRDHRIQAIVTAIKLDHDEDATISLGRCGPGEVGNEAGNRGGK